MSDAFGRWNWDGVAGEGGSVVARRDGGELYELFGALARTTFLEAVIGDLAPGSVFEVGCGKGQWLQLLKERGFDATGGDRSAHMVEQARKVDGRVTQFDAAAIPFPDRSFDNVLTVTVLQHLADPTRAIAEISRVARSRVIVHEMTRSAVPSALSPGTRARSASWFENAFAEHGLRLRPELTRRTARPKPTNLAGLMPRGTAGVLWLPRALGLLAAVHQWLVFER
ncbi:class I SAM-dependent methyltransferase [Actinomycetospora aeridis]|uniref:Class I SAM-dependent methyltransferase n=1 Tax=Actinomycetospora aeridis TaxID=3129231 RepID=A0ABU8NE94_9PSEU